MIPQTIQSVRWLPETHYLYGQLPVELAGWLRDKASLTDRIRSCCTGAFSVQVLEQGWACPRLHESRVLTTKHGERALVRQVHLLCDDQPWVFARTVIPVRTLEGPQRQLGCIGNKPLGAYLFSDPSMKRGPVEIAQHFPGNPDYEMAASVLKNKPSSLWGRRSVFRVGKKPLLVSELFLSVPSVGASRYFS
ncbi:MAG: chorismate lyase [Gammaproteobacteria bacterium]